MLSILDIMNVSFVQAWSQEFRVLQTEAKEKNRESRKMNISVEEKSKWNTHAHKLKPHITKNREGKVGRVLLLYISVQEGEHKHKHTSVRAHTDTGFQMENKWGKTKTEK